MTKKLIFAFALFSLSAVGCGKSVCEQDADQAEDCGETVSDFELELCEALVTGANEDALQDCIDCRDMAADSCTADDIGGPCAAICNN